ncbi:DUF2059 domain-containing protein [Sphingomicrobium sp. XHP0239]|uniref:DUF2059 domain-containing protein n=1 Tax=Sphingomicrobium maritimum TaxID=3133972 RepID=UPI0031CC866D
MKKILLAATAAAAFTATPAFANDTSQPVDSIRIAPSDARIALAREAIDLMYPQGQTDYLVNYMMGPYADYMLTTPLSQLAEDFGVRESAAAFGELLPMLMGEMGGGMEMPDEMNPEAMAAGVDMMIAMLGDKTIQGFIVEQDEHFEERLSIVRDVLQDRMPAIATEFEGPLRDALATVFAQKFTDTELSEIAAFADTPAGQKYARTYLVAQFEPAYYGGVMRAVPAVVPQFMPLVEEITERTSHLPPLFPETVYCDDLEEGDETECVERPTIEIPGDNDMTPQQQAAQLEAEAAEYEQMAANLRAEAAELRAQ